MNPRKWFQEHSLKLLAIRDTPTAIAGGAAIGFFFGFTPLFGLKTVSAIVFAWLTRSNILAAVIACTMHDLILPLMPAIFLWEYNLGYRILNHEWPHGVVKHLKDPHWREWTFYLTIGKPLLLGSVICGAPLSAIVFFVTRKLVERHQRKKQKHEAAGGASPSPGASPPP